MFKKVLCMMAAFALLWGWALAAPLENGAPMELTSPSAMLLEADTGAVIFEKAPIRNSRWPA